MKHCYSCGKEMTVQSAAMWARISEHIMNMLDGEETKKAHDIYMDMYVDCRGPDDVFVEMEDSIQVPAVCGACVDRDLEKAMKGEVTDGNEEEAPYVSRRSKA